MFLCLLLVFFITFSWGEAPENIVKVENVDLKVKIGEIIGTKTFEGQLLGADFDKNEVYIKPLYPEDFYSIGIMDIETGKIKKTLRLRKGNIQAPTDVYNPTYMQYMNGRYYLIDWFEKIMVFDDKLDYLYSCMFDHMRYFINFFQGREGAFFVIGRKGLRYKEAICPAEIYQMIERRIPKLTKKIHESSHMALNYAKDSAGRYFMGSLWSSCWGFEKDRKIYIANSSESKYFVYDLENEKAASIELVHLKGRKFSDKDARTVNLFVSQLHDETRFKHIAYPYKIYYFGFYDVGENKIGVAGDIDIEKMKFRLDILKADSEEYLKSIWLPIGHGFFRQIYETTRGEFHTFINVDKGVYVWLNKEGENLDFVVKITRFNIKNEASPSS